MRNLLRPLIAAVLFILPTTFVPSSSQAQDLQLQLLGRYETGIFDEGAAEITAYDPDTYRLFFVNADANEVIALDISNPAIPTRLFSVNMDLFGGGANSIAVANGMVAVAVQADDTQANGRVVLMTTDGVVENLVVAGALPDGLAFSPDGTKVVVANEGEPNDDYDVDPEGSITVIDLAAGIENPVVTQLGFSDFNVGGPRAAEFPADVRIFGPGATRAQDLEPEYVAISPDGSTAYVSLQENNALAVVDLDAVTISSIVSLGTKDHSLAENAFDASNRDDAINIRTWPVQGFYMPDGMTTYEVGGSTYVVTANEGDARDYDGFSEEVRVDDLTLDPTAFPDAATLQLDENLGRLKTTTASGDIDDDGDHDVIYSYGARSFSIWDAAGNLVWDSGDDIAQMLAQLNPEDFNSNNDENDSFDARSDDKGAEPENVVVGEIDGRFYAFVVLERMSGVMIFDVTNPTSPTFVSYRNARDFSVTFDEDNATADILSRVGDVGPEGIVFIPMTESPNGQNLLVTSNEVSGSVGIFQVVSPEPMTLTVLHNNDAESQLINAGSGLEDFGGAARFKTLVDNLKAQALSGAGTRGVVLLSSGDNYLPGPELNASLDLDDAEPFYDSRAQNAFGYDAMAIGNHEFDLGPDVLERFIAGFETPVPFLSANLDFSGELGLQALVDEGRIAASIVIQEAGQTIGVVGATTPNLTFISSPRNVEVLQDVASEVQREIDKLTIGGVDRIILISHLQGVEEDLALIPMLSGVDIVIAGGGDEILANAGDVLVPGDAVADAYPLTAVNANGDDVPVVTTAGSMKYVGRLIVEFDADGGVTMVDPESGPVRVAGGSEPDAVTPDPVVQADVVDPVVASVAALDANVIASSSVGLNGIRTDIRGRETNLGNLIADAFLWQADQLNESFGVGDPDVAMANGGGIRNDNIIPAGDVTELNTFDILPFANFVTVVENVSPERFKLLLENAVSAIGGGSGTGRFAQMAGLVMRYDPAGQALELDDGTVVTEGQRVRTVVLDDGTVMVENGQIVPGARSVNVVTVDFLARGGDEYPFGDSDFQVLGVSYQQALENYITDALGGVISATDYPEGGEGRTATLAESVATDSPKDVPTAFTHRGSYPNPTSNAANVLFDLPEAASVSVRVFDMLGREVMHLPATDLSPGSGHTIRVDGSALTAGVYFYRLTAETGSDRQVASGRMTLVR